MKPTDQAAPFPDSTATRLVRRPEPRGKNMCFLSTQSGFEATRPGDAPQNDRMDKSVLQTYDGPVADRLLTSLKALHRLGKPGHNLEEITDHPIVSRLKKRRFGVFIDYHDGSGAVDAGEMLDSP